MSFKVIKSGTNRKLVYNFLLVVLVVYTLSLKKNRTPMICLKKLQEI